MLLHVLKYTLNSRNLGIVFLIVTEISCFRNTELQFCAQTQVHEFVTCRSFHHYFLKIDIFRL